MSNPVYVPSALLSLAGFVALLLWGVHMVQTGVTRALGPRLRAWLGMALRTRLRAFWAGLGTTAVLQSSTATGLMITGFAASGMVESIPATAAMLGANVGTTLIVQVLSFPIYQVAPVLILIGVGAFRRARGPGARDTGRIFIGIGLMLLALHATVDTITPLTHGDQADHWFALLALYPVPACIIGILLAWAAHSSVVVVLLVLSLATRGVIPPDTAVYLVLGANIGTSINPVLEGTRHNIVARRLTVGLLGMRAVAAGAALLGLPWILPVLTHWIPSPVHLIANVHTAFNLGIAAVMLPVLPAWTKLMGHLLPAAAPPQDMDAPRYLDPGAIELPVLAMQGARQEMMRMQETLATMLTDVAQHLNDPDRHWVLLLRRRDDRIDRLHQAIRSYLAQIDATLLSQEDLHHMTGILRLCAYIEYAADVVSKDMCALLVKRIKRHVVLRDDQAQLLRDLIDKAQVARSLVVGSGLEADTAERIHHLAEEFQDDESRALQAFFTHPERDEDVQQTLSLTLDLIRGVCRVGGLLCLAQVPPGKEPGPGG